LKFIFFTENVLPLITFYQETTNSLFISKPITPPAMSALPVKPVIDQKHIRVKQFYMSSEKTVLPDICSHHRSGKFAMPPKFLHVFQNSSVPDRSGTDVSYSHQSKGTYTGIYNLFDIPGACLIR
jgi:hypothetical protein